jgi:hypothetical protein
LSPSSGSSSHLLPEGEGIRIEIYDIEGKKVFIPPAQSADPLSKGLSPRTSSDPLIKGVLYVGDYIWQPAPEVASGVYLVRAKTGSETVIRRVVYLK